MSIRMVLVYLVLLIAALDALRCRFDEAPSEEDLKRISRLCMKRIGVDTGFSKNGSDYNREKNKINYPYRGQNTNQRQGRLESESRQNERRYNNLMNQDFNGNYSDLNSSYYQNRRNQEDKACIVHCFFAEMNMLNNDEFPDKFKVLYILTKNIRDHELNEFYTDTIQECFRFLEMEQRQDKCQFSKSLLNCIAEYARTNCEDWKNHTLIFN